MSAAVDGARCPTASQHLRRKHSSGQYAGAPLITEHLRYSGGRRENTRTPRIAAMVNEQIEGAKATDKSVRWYAAKLRREGVEVPARAKHFAALMDEKQSKARLKTISVVDSANFCALGRRQPSQSARDRVEQGGRKRQVALRQNGQSHAGRLGRQLCRGRQAVDPPWTRGSLISGCCCATLCEPSFSVDNNALSRVTATPPGGVGE